MASVGRRGVRVSGSSVTYANKEQNWADWTSRDFLPYLIRFEAGLSRLLPASEHIKFNINALLRSDLAARYSSYKIAAEIGDITGTPLLLNSEMRGFENLQPIPGGDEFDRRTTPLPPPPGGSNAA